MLDLRREDLGGSLALESLRTVDQTTLGVGTAVDEIGVVEGELDGAVDDRVDGLGTQHEAVVLVADLVAPAAEAATRPDVLGLELGEELLEYSLALERRSGVTVVVAAVVGADNLVRGRHHLGVDKTLDAVGEHGLVVDGLHRGLGNLEHDAPVGTLLGLGGGRLAAIGELESGQLYAGLGLVVRRVVGEDGGAVEGAVVLGEVQPALVTNALGALTSDTDTDNVGGAVEEALRQLLALLILHGLGQVVNGHGVDHLLVVDGGAVAEKDAVVVGVDAVHTAVLTEAGVLLGESVGNTNPDGTSAALGREAEGGVGSPVTGGLLEDNVLGDNLEVGCGNTLTEPLALHLMSCQCLDS